MEIPNKNQQDTLPYEKLALLGIDREKADMLPQDVKQKLMQGEVTPLLQEGVAKLPSKKISKKPQLSQAEAFICP